LSKSTKRILILRLLLLICCHTCCIINFPFLIIW
jgi:hypothetical protein